jgi:hypothetical protein
MSSSDSGPPLLKSGMSAVRLLKSTIPPARGIAEAENAHDTNAHEPSIPRFRRCNFGAPRRGAGARSGTLYVKFTADVVTEFLLLSFKGKDDE